MKAISTVWLYVCLCTSLSVTPLMAAAGGAAAGADVPTNVRTTDETSRQLNASVVARNDIQILEHARAANDDVYASLQSFVCNEEINRFRGSLNGQTAHALDTVTAKLSFERGVEQYMIEETPVAMRRRLLLERAAWQLARTKLSVTEIGLNANYGSPEAFTRAFRRAFKVSPSLYRRLGVTYAHIHTTNGIHYYSGNVSTKGTDKSMDLFDIFAGQESWHTRRLLETAKTLNDEQLDRPLKNQMKVFPWDGPDKTLRQILDRMVQTKEVWAAALTGGSMPLLDKAPLEDRTPWAMLMRMDKADKAFHRVLTDVQNRSAWDDTFVDALCEPPETFTFGGMFADVITFNAHRRMLAIDALQRLGAKVEGCGSPIEYMAQLTA